MQSVFISTIICGLLAGITGSVPLGSLALAAFFPFLPLFYIGFRYGARSALHSGCIALLIALIAGGDASGFNMGIFVVVPSYILLQRLLMFRTKEDGSREWYSPLRAMSELTLFIVFVLLTLSVMASHHYETGLREVLKRALPMESVSVDASIADIMLKLTGEWGFVLFAALSWFWLITIWLLAYCVQEVLARQSASLRPNITLTPRGCPNWAMVALIISACMVLGGTESDAYTGKVLFLVMLFPYFLSGMAGLHQMSLSWKIRQMWLFFIYILLLFQPWTVVFPIGFGLYLYFSETLDKPKKIS